MNPLPTLLRHRPGTPPPPCEPSAPDPRVLRILACTARAWGLSQQTADYAPRRFQNRTPAEKRSLSAAPGVRTGWS